jgi:hypothetical protein
MVYNKEMMWKWLRKIRKRVDNPAGWIIISIVLGLILFFAIRAGNFIILPLILIVPFYVFSDGTKGKNK